MRIPILAPMGPPVFGSKCTTHQLKNLSSSRMAVINKMDNNKCWPGCEQTGTTHPVAGGNENGCNCFGKQFSIKVNTEYHVTSQLPSPADLQGQVDTAGLRLLSLKRPCLHIWPLAGVWELEFSECSHHSPDGEGWFTAPGGCVVYLNTAFLLGVWNFGAC